MAKKQKKPTILFNANTVEYAMFSNMFPSPFLLEGRWWTSVEQYFNYKKLLAKAAESKDEAAKTKELKGKILATFDPFKAKFFGSKKAGGTPNPKWDKGLRDKVMSDAHYEKFAQNPLLLIKLLSTKNALLIEDASWDDYWGSGKDGKGQNKNGESLMALRSNMLKSLGDDNNDVHIDAVFAFCGAHCNGLIEV